MKQIHTNNSSGDNKGLFKDYYIQYVNFHSSIANMPVKQLSSKTITFIKCHQISLNPLYKFIMCSKNSTYNSFVFYFTCQYIPFAQLWNFNYLPVVYKQIFDFKFSYDPYLNMRIHYILICFCQRLFYKLRGLNSILYIQFCSLVMCWAQHGLKTQAWFPKRKYVNIKQILG
jgi:hypothetical protein